MNTDKIKCNCINIEIGSYHNQVEVVDLPNQMIDYRAKQGLPFSVCIDACIVDEVKELWDKGITTTGCCCGHNKVDGYIGVIDSDIPKMKNMGYKVQYNELRPNDEDSFIPKSTRMTHADKQFPGDHSCTKCDHVYSNMIPYTCEKCGHGNFKPTDKQPQTVFVYPNILKGESFSIVADLLDGSNNTLLLNKVENVYIFTPEELQAEKAEWQREAAHDALYYANYKREEIEKYINTNYPLQ